MIADHVGADLHRLTTELDKILISFSEADRMVTPEIVEKEFDKLLESQNETTEEKMDIDDTEIRRLVSTRTRLEKLGFGKWNTEDCQKREKAFIEMFYGNDDDTIESIAERHAGRAFLIFGK